MYINAVQYMFDEQNKYMILKANSKGMYKVFYDFNKYYYVNLEKECCFCTEFEKNKSCEHYNLVKSLVF